MAYFWGSVAVVGLWVIAGIVGGRWNPLAYVMGTDGRLSTSKFQWLCWIVVAFFSYAAVYAARCLAGNVVPLETMPPNLLYILGFSTVTMAAAKGITSGYVNAGRLKKARTEDAATIADLVRDDTGQPELVKIQMIGWTFLAAVIYFIQLARVVNAGTVSIALPDVDATLMVLMGLSQGGYLSSKLVTTSPVKSTPKMAGVA